MKYESRYIKPSLNKNRMEERYQYKYDVQVFNDSRYDITMMNRNNVPVLIQGIPIQTATHSMVTIRTTHTINNAKTFSDIRNKINESYQQHGQFLSEDAELIFHVLNNGQANTNNAVIRIDRQVSINDLMRQGCLYINDIDLMLYYENYTGAMVHPYSEYAVNNVPGENIAKVSCTSGIVIQIVDNDEKIAKRFVYMADRIIEVPIITDSSRRSGMYLYDINNSESDLVFCELDELEKHQIYPTEEQAKTHGKPDLIHEKEIKRLKQESELKELESKKRIQELKEEYEIKRAEAAIADDERKRQQESEIARIKLDYEEKMRQKDYERQSTKDHFDERSYSRKSDYESIKTAGIMFTVILSIAAYLKKS